MKESLSDMTSKRLSRRSMLKWVGLGAAGVYVAGCGGAAPAPTAAPAAPAAPTTAAAAPTTGAGAPTAAAVATSAPAKTAPAKTPKKITFMSSGDDKAQAMFADAAKVANGTKALTDNMITVEVQPYPGSGWEKIMAMYAADAAYDVQRMNDDYVSELATANKIWQLDCFIQNSGMKKDDYYPVFWRSINLAGYQFCMNPLGGANVLYYNKDMFAAAGITNVPTTWKDAWTWDQFVDVCSKLSKRDSSGKVTQYALSMPPNTITPVIFGSGGNWTNDDQTKCAVDAPDTVAAIEAFAKLARPSDKLEYFAPRDLSLAIGDRTQLFNSKKCAMSWESMDFVSTISKDVNWDILPFCKTPKYAMTENYDRTWVISKTAKEPEAAFLVLKAFCEQPTVDVMSKFKLGVPYLKVAAEGPLFMDNNPPAHKNVWLETFGDINGHEVDAKTPRGPMGIFKATFTAEKLTGANWSGQMSTKDYVAAGCAEGAKVISDRKWKKGMLLDQLTAAKVITCPGTKIEPQSDNL